NTSVHVETQERPAQSEIRIARLGGDAERMDISGLFPSYLAFDGPNVHLDDSRGADELFRTPKRIRSHAYEPEPGHLLLRLVSGRRLDRRIYGVPDGKDRTKEAALVAFHPTLRLSTGNVLGDGKISLYRDPRSYRRLG